MTESRQTLKRQVAAKIESTEGTWETDLDANSTAKAYADFVVADVDVQLVPLNSDRPINMEGLAHAPQYSGGMLIEEKPARVRMSFVVELAGSSSNDGTSNAVAPPIARLLSACGMSSVAVARYPIASWPSASTSDVVLHGETVTGDGVGSFSGESFGNAASDIGSEAMYFRSSTITGSATAGETLTGATNGATATAGTAASVQDWGLALASVQADIPTLSILTLTDGREIKARGCRGNAVLMFTHTQRPVVTFEFEGIFEDAGNRSLMTGADAPTVAHRIAPTVNGVDFYLDATPGGTSTTDVPKWNTLEIDLGNVVSVREDANKANGLDVAYIRDREPMMSIDRDEVAGGVDQEVAFMRGHRHHAAFQLGSVAGNRWDLRVPAASIVSREPSERDPDTATLYTFELAAGQSLQDNLANRSGVARPFADDGEVVLINR